jgi:hypothetical protein
MEHLRSDLAGEKSEVPQEYDVLYSEAAIRTDRKVDVPFTTQKFVILAAQAGSFYKAARSLGVDPSVVARSINRLERELRVRLFDRTRQRFSVTHAGASFVREIIEAVIVIDRKSQKPLHRQIYDAFRSAILEGRLRPRQRVPSTRTLALELGMSRFPVISAYSQLLSEGYFESRVGSGTVVCSFPWPRTYISVIGKYVSWRSFPNTNKSLRGCCSSHALTVRFCFA